MSKILDKSYSTQVLSKTSMWEHKCSFWAHTIFVNDFTWSLKIKTLPLKKSSSYLRAHFKRLALDLFLAKAARRLLLCFTAGVKSSMMLIPFSRRTLDTSESRLACNTLTLVRTLGNLIRTGLDEVRGSPERID